jgi:hypothetical protein
LPSSRSPETAILFSKPDRDGRDENRRFQKRDYSARSRLHKRTEKGQKKVPGTNNQEVPGCASLFPLAKKSPVRLTVTFVLGWQLHCRPREPPRAKFDAPSATTSPPNHPPSFNLRFAFCNDQSAISPSRAEGPSVLPAPRRARGLSPFPCVTVRQSAPGKGDCPSDVRAVPLQRPLQRKRCSASCPVSPDEEKE